MPRNFAIDSLTNSIGPGIFGVTKRAETCFQKNVFFDRYLTFFKNNLFYKTL